MRAVCERQAIVWDTIERLAFSPLTDKDRNRWLSIYERSLPMLWGLQPTDIQSRRNLGFDAWFLNIACDFSIDAPKQYSVTIVNAATDSPASWPLHIDPGYCSRSSFYHPDECYPTQDMDRHLEYDVKAVLDGMIFHPRNHAHGDALGIQAQLGDDSALKPKEIRLGGGIENGFVFLTHLRYQFCLLSNEARQEERTRLIRLFTQAISDRRHKRGKTISAADLFALRA